MAERVDKMAHVDRSHALGGRIKKKNVKCGKFVIDRCRIELNDCDKSVLTKVRQHCC